MSAIRTGAEAGVRREAAASGIGAALAPRHAVRERASDTASDAAWLGVAALLFAASTVVTIRWCASTAAMGEMPMPGGWTMSMAWMRMPGQTWLGAAASFVAMWIVMTAAMMLPSLVAMLRRYRRAVAIVHETSARATRLSVLTALVGAGYLCVWTACGIAAFPVGVALATAAMRQPALARAAPLAAGVVVVLTGALQLSAWKRRQLACCRAAPARRGALRNDAGVAWAHGVRLGLRCSYCCAALTAALLVVGVMDLRAMAAVAAAISFERLARDGERAARVVGVLVVGAGLVLIARAAGLG